MKRELTIFDSRRTVRRLAYGFFISLGILVLLDFFVHRHAYFGFEGFTGFFAVFGFLSCILLLGVVWLMRLVLKRDEDYYNRE